MSVFYMLYLVICNYYFIRNNIFCNAFVYFSIYFPIGCTLKYSFPLLFHSLYHKKLYSQIFINYIPHLPYDTHPDRNGYGECTDIRHGLTNFHARQPEKARKNSYQR